MKVLGITGPRDAGRPELADRLVERLDDGGRVARVVEKPGSVRSGRGAQAVTYELGTDGWTAEGPDADLEAVLDRLAPDYEYAVLEGFPEASIPRVVLGGDGPGEGTTVATAPDADALDLDDVIDRLRDLEPYVTLESLVASVKRSSNAERAGAIATFTGRVRARDADDDEPTEFLEFEKYERVAEQRMDRLETELAEREGVQKVRLHHRTGRIPYGEDIVFVVVLAGHREEAFRTVEDGINRLKDEVPIFKREVTVEEEFWVHQRD
jgi:molybdopterin synthase catalytic subunit